jgi:hypothetical protein
MNIVNPLQGEFSSGHFGRVQLLNFFENSSETIYGLERQFGHKISPRKHVAVIHLIAQHCCLSVEEYALAHSLLPLSDFFVERNSDETCRNWEYKILRRDGMKQIRKRAYFCQECVEEDIEKRHYSYWRTIHQIPGMNWCWIHGYRAIFDGVNLSNLTISGINWVGVSLRGADLSNSVLTNVDMTLADLTHVNVKNGEWTDVNLERSTLSGTALRDLRIMERVNANETVGLRF